MYAAECTGATFAAALERLTTPDAARSKTDEELPAHDGTARYRYADQRCIDARHARVGHRKFCTLFSTSRPRLTFSTMSAPPSPQGDGRKARFNGPRRFRRGPARAAADHAIGRFTPYRNVREIIEQRFR